MPLRQPPDPAHVGPRASPLPDPGFHVRIPPHPTSRSIPSPSASSLSFGGQMWDDRASQHTCSVSSNLLLLDRWPTTRAAAFSGRRLLWAWWDSLRIRVRCPTLSPHSRPVECKVSNRGLRPYHSRPYCLLGVAAVAARVSMRSLAMVAIAPR